MGVKNIQGELRVNDEVVATQDWINQQIIEPIIATFNITVANTTITLKNLTGMAEIDWGDGVINNELSHTYTEEEEYNCKIYSVMNIGQKAFENCTSLTEIIIPGSVTHIRGYAFEGCSSLTKIILSDSVIRIEYSAFKNCSGLIKIAIPDSVTGIGDLAFNGCSSLTEVLFKRPTPITYQSFSYFQGCSALTHIYVPYGCKQAYIDKWTADGATQDILDKIIESDREAMMSDVDAKMDKPVTNEDKIAACEMIGAVPKLENPNATTSALPQAYILTANQEVQLLNISEWGASPNTIAKRDNAGRIAVATPSGNNDATNKKYVDDNFVPSITLAAGQPGKAYIVNTNGQAQMDIIPGEAKPWTIPQRTYNGRVKVGTPEETNDATTKEYVDELVYMSGELIRTASLWTPVYKEYTTISDTDGRTWNCDAVGYYNTRTNKHKVEYTLISTQEITANADNVAISVPLIGVNYTLGAKYRAATIAYSALPIIEDVVEMGNEKFKQSYFTLDYFTWDEQTDIGNECTPLPFRGSGGFEVKVLTWTEDPAASITFKTIIAKVTKYEV